MPANKYLEKYAYFGRLITESIAPGTQIIVVIPAYNERSILDSLVSLSKCKPISQKIEVIVVFNCSEKDVLAIKQVNKSARKEAQEWVDQNPTDHIKFHFITVNYLPDKFAGVGFARKIGMDEAVRRFQDIDCKNGIIVGFDADEVEAGLEKEH